MNTTLHVVDPHLDRTTTTLMRFTRRLVDIYLGLLVAFGTYILMALGGMFVIVSIVNIIKNVKDLYLAAIFIPIGLLLIISNTIRLIIWIFLGFATFWFIILTATLIPFLGESPSLALIFQVAIAFAYFLPPVIATMTTLRFMKEAEQDAAANP